MHENEATGSAYGSPWFRKSRDRQLVGQKRQDGLPLGVEKHSHPGFAPVHECAPGRLRRSRTHDGLLVIVRESPLALLVAVANASRGAVEGKITVEVTRLANRDVPNAPDEGQIFLKPAIVGVAAERWCPDIRPVGVPSCLGEVQEALPQRVKCHNSGQQQQRCYLPDPVMNFFHRRIHSIPTTIKLVQKVARVLAARREFPHNV